MVVAKIGGIPGCPSAPLLLPQSGGCGRLVLGVVPDAPLFSFAAAHRQLREIGGKDIPDTPCFFQSYQSLIVRTPLSALVMLVGAELHSQPFRHLPLLDMLLGSQFPQSFPKFYHKLPASPGRPARWHHHKYGRTGPGKRIPCSGIAYASHFSSSRRS